MANTVNDVMNVIASPDYGIKNIAGTNQEILAILSGTHNSKSNIHSLVNDVRSLLQNLVETTTKKQLVKIDTKPSRVNPKHVQNILDETKDIKKAFEKLAKAIEKQSKNSNMPAVAKLSNKASQRVANAMIKSMEKQNKSGGMAALVDAFTKLKDISLKDLILGKRKLKRIATLFKDAKEELKIKEKDLNSIIKLVNAAPEMVKSLHRVSWRINRIIKKEVVKKLGEIFVGKKDSLLTLAKALQKNTKIFNAGSKAAKSIENLTTSLKKAMRKIVFASLWSRFASIKPLEKMLDNIKKLSKKLTKSQQDFNKGSKASKNMRNFIGNLLITSIFLTLTLVTVIPAIVGALALRLLVSTLIPIGKQLSRNRRKMAKATAAALIFTAFTGLMLISSYFLTKIADNALPTLLGSAVMFGVVIISVLTFAILNKAKKNILIGSIMMAIMSLSLLLFGVALGKITKATEKVSWKQVGIIAVTAVMLGLIVAVLGIPAVAPFIILGGISLAVMSAGLLVFGLALGKITPATENLKFKQVLVVSGAILLFGIASAVVGALLPVIALGCVSVLLMSLVLKPFADRLNEISKATEKMEFKHILLVAGAMGTLGLAISGMAILLGPIALGALALGSMSSALHTFVKSLKIISDMKKVPKKEIDDVIEAMEKISEYFSDNALSFKTTRNARRYTSLMIPFGVIVGQISKLKELGGNIPMELITQTLSAMRAIGSYFIENPIKNKHVRQARKYKRMLRPFATTVSRLNKLKDMGSVPMQLILQTLSAMNVIAEYYKNNPIERKVIKEARRYKRMLRPFGSTVGYLSKLKELGSIPMQLVFQTLNTISEIANYYKNNEVDGDAIDNAEDIMDMLKPFGNTVGYLTNLKKLGSIPMHLVLQTLNAISTIVDYYQNQDMGGFFDRWAKEASAETIATIVSSFGVAAESLKIVSELKRPPKDLVESTISAISSITWFYMTTYVSGSNLDEKSSYIEMAVDRFTTMAKNIQDKFNGMSMVDHKAVQSVANACRAIINFYTFTPIFVREKKIAKMNDIIERFADTAKYLKDCVRDFSLQDVIKVGFALKSMKKILKFLKKDSLGRIAVKKAQRNLSLLSRMADVMLNISKVDPSSVSSIGDSLTTALQGVHAVDISQVNAVTNMFNAFRDINKSENIISKFADSVKEFTESCKELMNAMEHNTDAINGLDMDDNGGGSFFDRLKNKVGDFIGLSSSDSSGGDSSNGGAIEEAGIKMKVANVEELAASIAKKINGTLSLDVPDTQVQLTINGTGGNEWVISKY